MLMEKDAWHIHGILTIVVLVILAVVGIFSLFEQEIWFGLICFGLGFVLATGLAIVQPNQALIVEWFGKYVGTYRNAGLVMVIPFATKRKVSLRIRQHKWEPSDSMIRTEGGQFSVLVLYKIVDAVKVTYEIEQLESYLDGQIELVLHEYTDLRQMNDEVEAEKVIEPAEIKTVLQNRLHTAGITLLDVQVQQLMGNPLVERKILNWIQQLLVTIDKKNKQYP